MARSIRARARCRSASISRSRTRASTSRRLFSRTNRYEVSPSANDRSAAATFAWRGVTIVSRQDDLRLARLVELCRGLSQLGRRALLDRGVGRRRALELGCGPRAAGLIGVEERQADVDARSHLESVRPAPFASSTAVRVRMRDRSHPRRAAAASTPISAARTSGRETSASRSRAAAGPQSVAGELSAAMSNARSIEGESDEGAEPFARDDDVVTRPKGVLTRAGGIDGRGAALELADVAGRQPRLA